jgi:hypothetical protein
MNKYQAFFDRKTTELEASSLWDAKQKAVAFFKPAKSKQHMVSVVVVEVEGRVVEHSTANF